MLPVRARKLASKVLDHNLCLYAGLAWMVAAMWALGLPGEDLVRNLRQVGMALLMAAMFLALGVLMEFWRLIRLFGKMVDLQGKLAEAYAGKSEHGPGWAGRHRLR